MPNLPDLIRLLRPKQWAKSAFVLIGPLYGMRGGGGGAGAASWALEAAIAATAFALASSACYACNDVLDAPRDRLHPRKAKRPVASGRVSPGVAVAIALALLVVAGALCLGLHAPHRASFAAILGLYVANTLAYSVWFKHVPVLDVISLAMGFVLRVLGGCAAVGIEPSNWLLNSTFFLSMFLALGKRLGERRTAEAAGIAMDANRPVQREYSADLLRMMVVVTAVATLITYALYVQNQAGSMGGVGGGGAGGVVVSGLATPNSQAASGAVGRAQGFRVPLLWLTMLPATFALLRALLLLEQGKYDDPTELAFADGQSMLAAATFAGLTALAIKSTGAV